MKFLVWVISIILLCRMVNHFENLRTVGYLGSYLLGILTLVVIRKITEKEKFKWHN